MAKPVQNDKVKIIKICQKSKCGIANRLVKLKCHYISSENHNHDFEELLVILFLKVYYMPIKIKD